MPKMKTCKSISKRVRLSASGKVKRYGIGRRHLLSSKTTKRKRILRKGKMIVGSDVKKIRQALTYL